MLTAKTGGLRVACVSSFDSFDPGAFHNQPRLFFCQVWALLHSAKSISCKPLIWTRLLYPVIRKPQARPTLESLPNNSTVHAAAVLLHDDVQQLVLQAHLSPTINPRACFVTLWNPKHPERSGSKSACHCTSLHSTDKPLCLPWPMPRLLKDPPCLRNHEIQQRNLDSHLRRRLASCAPQRGKC